MRRSTHTQGKVFSGHVIKAYDRSRGIVPLILNLGIIWKSVINLTPGCFTLGKNPEPNEQEGGCEPEPVRTFGGQNNFLPLSGFEPRFVQPLA
jgi:hypothetical protein